MLKNKKTNYTILNCFLISAILLITIVYLLEVNTGISYGLNMKENDLKLTNLNIENERLLKRVTELGSMANIFLISKNLDMVKIGAADYLIPVDETLAGR